MSFNKEDEMKKMGKNLERIRNRKVNLMLFELPINFICRFSSSAFERVEKLPIKKAGDGVDFSS